MTEPDMNDSSFDWKRVRLYCHQQAKVDYRNIPSESGRLS